MSQPARADILLLGDGGEDLRRFSAALEDRGHRVRRVGDPWDGVQFLLEEAADLMVLVLPGGTADDEHLRLVHGLTRRPPASDVPLAVFCGPADRRERVRALRAGADDVLDPGMDDTEWLVRVDHLLRMGVTRRRLREEHLRLHGLMDLVDVAVLLIDEDGMVTATNRRTFDILRLDPDILRLRTIDQILNVLGVSRETTDRLGRGDIEVDEEFTALVDGLERVLRIRCQRLCGPGLGVSGATWGAVLEDLTVQRQRERQQADFHSMIAHDLRSPISVLQGYLSLLQGGTERADLPEVVDRMAARLGEVSRLLDDFLDFAQMEAGFLRLEPEGFEVGEFVDEVVSDLRVLADRHRVTLSARADEPARRARVEADRGRLRQVLQNLLTNAFKYTRRDTEVTVEVQAGEGRVRIRVHDRGPGVPEEDRLRIFDRYQRSRPPVDGDRGLGLGLVIVRHVVLAHGGSAGVEARPGGGSTFWVELPAQVASPLPS